MIKRLLVALDVLRGKYVVGEFKLLKIDQNTKIILECENSLTKLQKEYLNSEFLDWLTSSEKRVLILDGGLHIRAYKV